MFDSRRLGRAKLPICLSTISLAAIYLFIISANTSISNLSLQTTHDRPQKLMSSYSTHEVPLLVKQEVEESDTEQDHTLLVLPFNVTDKKRLEILKSTILARQFDDRVREFFGNDDDQYCKVKFFMTWISPASSFGTREFIAMESLFKANPHGCLTILSKTMDSVRGLRILKPLLDHGFRVLAAAPDLPFLFKDTPAESWLDGIQSGDKDPGEIPLAQNLSNLIRLAILYKYGGVYLDTDFITLKDFSGLRNSIGAQSVDKSGNWTRLNNAVLVFDKNHPLLYEFMKEFESNFDGNRWGHNGPYLVSRVVRRIETGLESKNFTVLQPMAFYPADWNRIGGFFAKPINRIHSKWVEAKLRQLSGATYGVHLWNRQSRRLRIEKGSIIGRLIKDNCVSCKHMWSS